MSVSEIVSLGVWLQKVYFLHFMNYFSAHLFTSVTALLDNYYYYDAGIGNLFTS
jgi:hypothetical protein